MNEVYFHIIKEVLYILLLLRIIYIYNIKVLIGNPSFIRLVYVLRRKYIVHCTKYILRSTFGNLFTYLSWSSSLSSFILHPSSG